METLRNVADGATKVSNRHITYHLTIILSIYHLLKKHSQPLIWDIFTPLSLQSYNRIQFKLLSIICWFFFFWSKSKISKLHSINKKNSPAFSSLIAFTTTTTLPNKNLNWVTKAFLQRFAKKLYDSLVTLFFFFVPISTNFYMLF